MQNCGVYEIRNKLNDKRYIGSAVDLKRRWRQHLRMLARGRHHSRYLQNSWNKYGGEAFEFRAFSFCVPDELIVWEQSAMDLMKPEYNASPTAGSIMGMRWQNLDKRGVKRPRDLVEKTAAAHRGMKRSAATRAKISSAMKGKKQGPRNAEWCAKLSASLAGKPKSPEHTAKMRATKSGMKLSPEHRVKIGISSRRAWASRKAKAAGNEQSLLSS